MLQLVTFTIEGEEYAVDVLKVREVCMMTRITHVPESESSVEGVINLRGTVIPVINLRRKFGLSRGEPQAQSRVMIVDVGSTVGLVVDSVRQVLTISEDAVEPPPPFAGSGHSGSVIGIVKLEDRLLLLLDLDALLGVKTAQPAPETGEAIALESAGPEVPEKPKKKRSVRAQTGRVSKKTSGKGDKR
jgi:purine-binding chemotaxis protein CheW